MKIYHPETGEVLEREPVDCREICTVLGYLMWPMKAVQVGDKMVQVEDAAPDVVAAAMKKEGKEIPESAVANNDAEAKRIADAEAMTVTDLREALDKAKVDIPNGSKKDDLVELFLKLK